MKVLVLGGTGIVGRHTVERLLAAGDEVASVRCGDGGRGENPAIRMGR
jgi:nucleoside-diphosphate-sugar epimerase